jgi:cytochrome c55X
MLAPMDRIETACRRRRASPASSTACRGLLLALLASAPAAWAQADAAIPERRQRELIHMVRQDCGACHGMTLKGGLGPPLTPDALRDKPAESLAATILNGRPGTPMPPWGRFLSTEEGEWIANALLRGLPAD